MTPIWPVPPHLDEVALGKSGVHAFEGTFEEFRDNILDTARQSWREVRNPGGDATPFLVFGHVDHVTLMRIPGKWFNNAATKEMLIERIFCPLIVSGSCIYAAVSTANWLVSADSPAGIELDRLRQAGEPTPSFDELGLNGVVEQAIVNVYAADRHEFWQGRVTRLVKGAPVLGKYRSLPDAAYFTGLFVEPIVEALKEVAERG